MIADVTIVVAIYNVEKYIDKCLNSLVNQTYQNIQILAVSDGSQDGSMDIVEKYAVNDKRITPVYKENGGYGSVLQYAEENIKSEYFLICDPDDWLAYDAIENLLKYAVSKKADIVVSDRYDSFAGKKAVYKSIKPEWLTEIYPNTLYTDKNEIQKFAFFEVSPHGKLYRTRLLKGIVFPKKVSFTDYVLYILALDRADSIVYCDKSYAYYYIDRVGNSYSDMKISRISDDITVWETTLNQITERHNDCSEICYLLQEMVLKLLAFYREYVMVRKQDSNGKYKDRLSEAVTEMQNYRTDIFYLKWIEKNKVIKKSFIKHLLNKNIYKITINLYCTLLLIKS